MRKLTAKQAKVVDQLLTDPSLKRCSEVTGVSYDYIRGLHTKPHILAILDERRQKVAEKAEVDAAYVLEMSNELLKRCMQHTPVCDKDGNETGEFAFDSAGAARALKLLGDHCAVQAFQPGAGPPAGPPGDTKWVVEIVHVSAETYRQRLKDEAEKLPIEHKS